VKKAIISLFIFSLSYFFIGCNSISYREAIRQPEKTFYQGQYKIAARMLLPMVNKHSRDQLLYMMECGYMLQAGKDYKISNSVLLKAGKLAVITPTSISKQTKALLSNDRATNYKGEDFEKVLVHMYLGINYLKLKDYDNARVEFKKVNNELSKIRKQKGSSLYKQNIMAKYLTAISYEISGTIDKDVDDLDYAYVEYKQIQKLAPNLRLVQRDLLRLSKKLKYQDDYAMWKRQFGNLDNTKKDSGELVVIYGAGKSPIKVSRGKLMSDRLMRASIYFSFRTMRFAAGVTTAAIIGIIKNAENPIPRFVRRPSKINKLRIRINNRVYQTYLLEDIENTAIRNLQNQYSKLQKRVAGSIVAKAAASIAAGLLTRALTKKTGFGALFGSLATLGTGAALFSQMRPDLRCWHTLPARLYLGRIFLPTGKYKVSLEFLDNNNFIIKKKDIDINIKKGEKTIIKERTVN